MKKYCLFILLLCLCLFNYGCKKYDEDGYQIEKNLDYVSDQSEDAEVKNIILIIGDGMGANQVEFTKKYGPRKELDLEKAEYKGLIDTNCLNNYVTDSAAAATAMATGTRTLYKRVGMDEDGNELKTILDYAHEAGLMTGLLTNDNLYGATPSGFSAHATDRYLYTDDMIEDQITSTIDVLMGYGEAEYYKYKDKIAANGWDYTNNRETMNDSKSSKLLSVFSNNAKVKDDIPTLPEMTEKALDILSEDEDGFILVVEEAQVDKNIDNGNIEGMVESVINLDKVLRISLNFMRKNDDTLVIVLADHETGGLVLGDGEPSLDWFTEPERYHTNVKVPVYAYGNRSSVFDNCDILNTDIFYIMKRLLEI